LTLIKAAIGPYAHREVLEGRMAEIFDAIRCDISSGTTKLHRGTKDYLERLGATLVDKSGRQVPDDHVDAKGRYVKDEKA
jgi:hypothetical protein